MKNFYYKHLVAAFIRGKLDIIEQYTYLWQKPLTELTNSEIEILIEIGKNKGLRLHKFKRTMQLQRVRKVLGMLKAFAPAELLDIGSGRGTFL